MVGNRSNRATFSNGGRMWDIVSRTSYERLIAICIANCMGSNYNGFTIYHWSGTPTLAQYLF